MISWNVVSRYKTYNLPPSPHLAYLTNSDLHYDNIKDPPIVEYDQLNDESKFRMNPSLFC